MKRIKFNTTFFDEGVPKYEVGMDYPVTEETRRQVVIGIAEEIEIEIEEAAAEEKVEESPAPEAAAPETIEPAEESQVPAEK